MNKVQVTYIYIHLSISGICGVTQQDTAAFHGFPGLTEIVKFMWGAGLYALLVVVDYKSAWSVHVLPHQYSFPNFQWLLGRQSSVDDIRWTPVPAPTSNKPGYEDSNMARAEDNLDRLYTVGKANRADHSSTTEINRQLGEQGLHENTIVL